MVVNDNIAVDFGSDVPGTITGNGNVTSSVVLTSNGNQINVSYDAANSTYTGTIAGSGTVAFTLQIATDGNYKFTQFEAIDHPNTNDPDDALNISFGVSATDSDGDVGSGNITVTIDDDGPIARDDFNLFDVSLGSTSGNVITGLNGGAGAADTVSQDDATIVNKVIFAGNEVTVPEGGFAIIDGNYGQLKIFSDGNYDYVLNDDIITKTVSKLNPDAGDCIAGDSSFTDNGITVSVGDPVNPNIGKGVLSWVETIDAGSGIGVRTGGSPGINGGKIWKGEVLQVNFAPADNVKITVAEIGPNNFGDGIDFKVYLASDPTTPIYMELQLPAFTPNGLADFVFDASSFGADEQIVQIDMYSVENSNLERASFLLNNVEVTNHSIPDIKDEFTYVITDADGDEATALLKFDGLNPELIVGSNANDIDPSNTVYEVGDGSGTIVGSAVSDVLIGDVGGATITTQQQDYNILMVLDISGSMGSSSDSDSKISLMVDAISNLLTEFSNYQNGEIKVHLTPFNKYTRNAETFTVTDAQGFSDAIDYLNNLDGRGWTNYESGLQSGIDWLQSNEALDGATNISYFLSDGVPNHYLNDNSKAINGGEAISMAEILGTRDGSNEVQILQNLSDKVIGVGIDIGDKITNIDLIDTTGSAINVTDPNDLDAQLAATNPLIDLNAVGNDTLVGGSGDDVIFGDSVFTDDLAASHGLNTGVGTGWEVFARLEAGESTTNPNWTRADTIEYIRNNAELLAAESLDGNAEGRLGGNDKLSGGDGDDVLYGQEGDDELLGNIGNDTLIGGSGSDTFVLTKDGSIDTIVDFDQSAGDVLDIQNVLQGYDPLADNLSDFVQLTEQGGNTLIQVDTSGNGTSFETVAVLDGVTGLNVDDLTSGGNLIA